MTNKINIDQGSVANHSSTISNAASCVELQNLSSTDNETTIAGNELSQTTFAQSQTMQSQLVTALENEAKKIQSLGNKFKSVDTQLSNMVKQISSK